MSTRLHALGFSEHWTLDAAAALDRLAAGKSRLIGAAKGNYRLWRTPAGAELWFHFPANAERRRTPVETASAKPRTTTSVTPFHRGLSCCRLKIGRYLSLDRANPLEGSCLAWLPAAEAGSREQVIMLELVPYGLQPLKTPPFSTTAQIVCFAHAAWAFDDTVAYARHTPANRQVDFGSYTPVTEADVPEVALSYRHSPVTLGLASGIIRRSIRHLNPVTGAPYYWLLLETRRGQFDVVVNPSRISGDISEGQVAQVCGSFLARLTGTPT